MAPLAPRKRGPLSNPGPSTKNSTISYKRQKTGRAFHIKDRNDTEPKHSYFSLPAEIRNEIAALTLTGGHVHLKKPNVRRLRSNANKDNENASAPGVGLLATCRQAYDEGHVMYWTDNVFHLPRGSLEEMKELLAKIKPEHLAMMRRAVLKLTLLDLTPSVLSAVEADLRSKEKDHFRTRSEIATTQGVPLKSNSRKLPRTPEHYANSIRDVVGKVWQQKLECARSSFSSLKELQVRMRLSPNTGYENALLRLRGRRNDGWIGCCDSVVGFSIIANHVRMRGREDLTDDDIFESLINQLLPMASGMLSDYIRLKIKAKGWESFKRNIALGLEEQIEDQERDVVGVKPWLQMS